MILYHSSLVCKRAIYSAVNVHESVRGNLRRQIVDFESDQSVHF